MLNGEKTGIGLAMEQYRYARREVNLKSRFNRGITTPLLGILPIQKNMTYLTTLVTLCIFCFIVICVIVFILIRGGIKYFIKLHIVLQSFSICLLN